MSRLLRILPPREPGAPTGTLVEVTNRTLHGRFFLEPSPEVNDVVLGVLGRAQRRYAMRICALVFMSNHFHLLLDVDDALQMSRFMGYFSGNLAKELARSKSWREKIWARRYQAIVVSNEEKAQVARLAYILSHGWKEGLVSHPSEWAGAHSVDALTKGTTLEGHWYDRSKQYAARRRGQKVSSRDFAIREEVLLSPLPCWAHSSSEQRRHAAQDLLTSIVNAGESPALPQPSRAYKSQVDPDQGAEPRHPKKLQRSPAPAFHAHTKEAFEALRQAYNSVALAYRRAADQLRKGLEARFPAGTFPPALPFVGPSVVI